MTLDRRTTFNSLSVCEKCGWPMAGPYETKQHHDACPLIAEGKTAEALAERCPEPSSTKCGYGSGYLTFELDKELHIRFQCRTKTFKLEEVWCLSDLSLDEAAELMKLIAGWRAKRGRIPR
jgi:hypothetical protein